MFKVVKKSDIINKVFELGFEDVGFTTAAIFKSQVEVLASRKALYDWTAVKGLDLINGVDPKRVYPEGKSIVVLMENYFNKSFPKAMENTFGRCYLDDDRVTKDGLFLRIKAFRGFLRDHGVESKVPFNIPHRLAAARAGLGTFGKNCLFYSRKAAKQSSWTLPIAIITNQEFEPDNPTITIGCPDWCRNACIVACPTQALLAPRKLDPRRCISFLTYYGEEITPLEFREPMGMWIYGCDRCQNICPRNQPWLAEKLPVNEKVAAMKDDFDLIKLLHMDMNYFKTKIWPHMFYVPPKEIWRWKMNAARALGNSRDPSYIPQLVKAYSENNDERVQGMCAWALGRIGGHEAKKALRSFVSESNKTIMEEVETALAFA